MNIKLAVILSLITASSNTYTNIREFIRNKGFERPLDGKEGRAENLEEAGYFQYFGRCMLYLDGGSAFGYTEYMHPIGFELSKLDRTDNNSDLANLDICAAFIERFEEKGKYKSGKGMTQEDRQAFQKVVKELKDQVQNQ